MNSKNGSHHAKETERIRKGTDKLTGTAAILNQVSCIWLCKSMPRQRRQVKITGNFIR
jgi:hypothetical protein